MVMKFAAFDRTARITPVQALFATALVMFSVLAIADEALPTPRHLKGAQERPHDEFLDTRPTAPMDLRKQQSRVWKQQLVNNMRVGMGFLRQNSELPGVKTLKSGVQIRTLVNGEGRKPGKDVKSVSVKYVGRLIDGTQFASSAGNGQDVSSLQLKSAVPGLRQAIKTLMVGSRAQIVVPPDQGYGDAGFLPVVGPGTVLIYDLELVGIEEATQKSESPANDESE